MDVPGVYPVHRRHVDGSWPAAALTPEGEYLTDASEGKLRSRLTLLVYLSEGFLGGATTFYTVGLIWVGSGLGFVLIWFGSGF